MARFKIGDKVILGDHFIDGANRGWHEICMRSYVGKKATLVRIAHGTYDAWKPLALNYSWYVDVDSGAYYWFEANMKSCIEYPGQKCNECDTSAPHGEPKNGVYICDFCKAMKDLGELTSLDRYKENWDAVFGKK